MINRDSKQHVSLTGRGHYLNTVQYPMYCWRGFRWITSRTGIQHLFGSPEARIAQCGTMRLKNKVIALDAKHLSKPKRRCFNCCYGSGENSNKLGLAKQR